MGNPCYVTEGEETKLLKDVIGGELEKEKPIIPPGLLQPGRWEKNGRAERER